VACRYRDSWLLGMSDAVLPLQPVFGDLHDIAGRTMKLRSKTLEVMQLCIKVTMKQ